MNERTVQNKVLDYLKGKGYVIKVVASNRAGTPDVIALIEGTFYGIEVKAPGKKRKVSKLQHKHLEEIVINGGVSIVVDSVDDLKEKGL